MAGWRSTIQTMALLYPATTICVLAEFPIQQQQLGWRKKLQRASEQTQYITPTQREMRTAELVLNRELMM